MPLFRPRKSHEDKVLWSLTKAIRLLLPSDPGPEKMLEACQQYSPAARMSKMNKGWICADGRHFRVHSPGPIEPESAQRAGLPSDLRWAFYTDWDGAQLGLDTRGRKLVDEQYREKSRYVLGGLAARFGGLWAPHPPEVEQPLRAYVFTLGKVDAADLLTVASRYAPGLALGDPRSDNVITVRGDGALSRVQYWPPFPATLPKGLLITSAGVPGALDPAWPDDDTAVITVDAARVAEGAGTEVAGVVGGVALDLAAQTDGVCVDVFGFRVRDPADLVIRAG